MARNVAVKLPDGRIVTIFQDVTNKQAGTNREIIKINEIKSTIVEWNEWERIIAWHQKIIQEL